MKATEKIPTGILCGKNKTKKNDNKLFDFLNIINYFAESADIKMI